MMVNKKPAKPWKEMTFRELTRDALIEHADAAEAHIVETNTYYEGDRYTTEKHRETLKVNGWTFCPVDILDEDGTAKFPVKGVLYLSTFFEICLFPATVRVLEQHLS